VRVINVRVEYLLCIILVVLLSHIILIIWAVFIWNDIVEMRRDVVNTHQQRQIEEVYNGYGSSLLQRRENNSVSTSIIQYGGTQQHETICGFHSVIYHTLHDIETHNRPDLCSGYQETHEEREPRFGFTDQDVFLLAQLLSGQEGIHGHGEYCFEWNLKNGRFSDKDWYEMSKVLTVVYNRLRHSEFPNDVRGVLLQRNQFSVFPRNERTIPYIGVVNKVLEWTILLDSWDDTVLTHGPEYLFFRAGPGLTNIVRKNYR